MTPGDGSGLAAHAAHRAGIPGSIRGCARRSRAGSRACEERGETSARVPSACPSMRRRQGSREEGANLTGESSEPVSPSPSAKSCPTAALERAGPLRPPHLPPPAPAPSLPAAAAPAPGQSRAALGWEHTKCHHGSAPASLCHLPVPEQGDGSRSSRGTPLPQAHQHLCTPCSAQRLGWMWVEIAPLSCD